MRGFIRAFVLLIPFVFTSFSNGSEDSLGPNGINSLVTGLNGAGVPIGQVEGLRPGKFEYDTAANCCNSNVVPTGVFALDSSANVNQAVSDGHALWVASVIISSQTAVDPATGVSPPIGVAQEADLFSSAFLVNLQPGVNLQEEAAVASQTLATGTWAINMSFGLELDPGFQPDGNSLLTQFVDWSTRIHEVLYVVAGNEMGKLGVTPSDSFNGITVAASRKEDGVFRAVTADNVYNDEVDATGDRTSTDILAPGFLIDAAGANGSQPNRADTTGTSFAAPHVTGTIALLHQAANTTNGRRHETKKAILLNSADKIKGIIGMERTVTKQNGSTWMGSEADTDPFIPLDLQMGAGHLNAKRAVQQITAGEQPPGGIGLIGWDYAVQDDPFINNWYTFGDLNEGDYVSVTMVWDRLVGIVGAFEEYQRGDQFVDAGFSNMDIYLVNTSTGSQVAASTSFVENLEHIFARIPETGSYRIEVDLVDLESPPVPYALAWWAGADEREPNLQGDFNNDGNVDAADYVMWRKTNGSAMDYSDWVQNFGAISGSGNGLSVPEPYTALPIIAIFIGISSIRKSRCAI